MTETVARRAEVMLAESMLRYWSRDTLRWRISTDLWDEEMAAITSFRSPRTPDMPPGDFLYGLPVSVDPALPPRSLILEPL